MKTTLLIFCCLLTNIGLLFSQINFNQYKPLRSVGEMPEDFSLAAKIKISNNDIDLGNLSKKQQNEFLENIHYGIDRLLSNGLCTYGDDVSKYVTAVANNLLKDDPKTKEALRFYILKSNVSNAFSTNQGIIFITTGLIAQFANEAQLAFVLAHEIAHYKFNHVVQSFELSKDKEVRNDIEQMSKYSKDHEFEADREAVKMCYSAGYSKDEIYGSFDVLIFSHLPFDEYKLNKDYFNTEYFYIPESIFSKKEYSINTDEDYDDEMSSHPNIQKRRDTVGYHINQYTNWSDSKFILDPKTFSDIRNICRFETVRARIVDGDLGYALYEIFVLEKEFPNSESLQAIKAHAYYDLSRRRVDFTWKDLFPSEKNLEGESAIFLNFLVNQKKDQTFTMSLRNIYDIHKKYPNNEYITNSYNKIVGLVANGNKINSTKFYDYTYKEAERKAKEETTENTPVKVEEKKKEEEGSSKYSRIRQSTNKAVDGKVITGVDTLNYHLYGISDIITNPEFVSLYKELSKEEKEEDVDVKSTKKKKKFSREENIVVNGKINSNEKLIIANPLILTSKSNINNAKRATDITPNIIDAIDYALKATNTNFIRVGSNTEKSEYNTKAYNQTAFIFELLNQVGDLETDMLPIIPIDYDQSLLMMSQFGSKRIAYFFYGEKNQYPILFRKIFGYIWLPPSLLMNVLDQSLARQNALAAIYTFDLETGYYQTSSALRISMKPSKMVLRSTMYNLINRK